MKFTPQLFSGEKEAGWAPEIFWMFGGENLLPVPEFDS
jgi:hypothetical protein